MAAQPPPEGMPIFQAPPGMPQPTPEQIAEMQRQLIEEARKAGVSVQQYVEQLKAQAMAQHQQQMRMQQQAQQQGQQGQHQHQHQHEQQQQQGQPQAQQISLNGDHPPPKPEALAVANFLKSQDLKPRTSLFNNERKEMFRVKRAIRALESPAYQKARSKNPLLPEVNDRVTAENTFKMLPMSLLALRVSKVDPHEGHNHGPVKRVKGQWSVQVEQHQEAHDDMYYIWIYEGSQIKTKLYAVGALTLILAVVFFPVWPYKLRLGVWYLSMGALGLLGLFFGMAIVRLILFIITMFAVPPGLWLYPNLFEDVGFFDSFKPLWAWQETKESRKAARAAKRAKKQARLERRAARTGGHQHGHVEEEEVEESGSGEEEEEAEETVQVSQGTTGAQVHQGQISQRKATVEEADDE
ncbi:translocation protein Sec62-domain-containing protein [Elsinoe ampelina]|uniref:Translocation protein SEC62 n=1 Tax=Elsinoe ampelina TaxID=302913 RepID=A0A6A6GAQ4_9PEZI|nr:translocation protein Sec62-domain-containing protein [Elsinoe ampelina]